MNKMEQSKAQLKMAKELKKKLKITKVEQIEFETLSGEIVKF
jgi:hypothetical protein